MAAKAVKGVPRRCSRAGAVAATAVARANLIALVTEEGHDEVEAAVLLLTWSPKETGFSGE